MAEYESISCPFCGTSVPSGFTVCSGCGANYGPDGQTAMGLGSIGMTIFVGCLVLAVVNNSIGWMIFGLVVLIAFGVLGFWMLLTQKVWKRRILI